MAPAPPTSPDERSLASLLKNKASSRALALLVLTLRRRLLPSSLQIALSTALLLKQIVSNARFSSLADLLLLLRLVGRELEQANRGERAQGNVVRKVMKLIREEWKAFALAQGGSHAAAYQQQQDGSYGRPTSAFSLSRFLANSSSSSSAKAHAVPLGLLSDPFGPSTAPSPLMTGAGGALEPQEYTWDSSAASGSEVASLKPLLIQAIQEVIDELETVNENVAKSGSAHVHASETILTLSHSKSIESFLKSASRSLSTPHPTTASGVRPSPFTVLILSTSPSLLGLSLAHALSAGQYPLQTLLLPDSNLPSFLPSTSKLLLPAHLILPSGGILAPAGSLLAAALAKAHAVQVVVVSGAYKCTPSWTLGVSGEGGERADPGEVLGFREAGGDGVEVWNEKWDYLGPELIDVFLTDHGDHSPSYIHKLIKDMYDEEDLVF